MVVVSLADRFGERSAASRRDIEREVSEGRVRAFLWEGCSCLITEDQRYLLGMHYVDYRLGPNAVPMIQADGSLFPAKEAFDRELLAGPERSPGHASPA